MRAHLQHFCRRFDLLLAGEEDEDVAGRLRGVDLQHRHHGGVDVVRFRRLRVEHVDAVAAAGNAENGRVVEKLQDHKNMTIHEN